MTFKDPQPQLLKPESEISFDKEPNVSIELYQDQDKQKVIGLIIGVQQEFGIDITLAQQPDLQDIIANYKAFFVAKVDSEIVGTIGVLDIGHSNLVLKKMFVHQEHRGKDYRSGKIADQLLQQVLQLAKQEGYKNIYLGTVAEKFGRAVRFYKNNGFGEIKDEYLPTGFPRMSVDTMFMRKDVI